MFFPAGIDFIVAFFGCLLAGTVPVTAYPPRKNRSLQRIHTIVNSCGADSVLTTDAIAHSLQRNFSEDALLSGLSWHIAENWNDYSPDDQNLYEPELEDLAFLQYTSGSTGDPKGVMISHRNIMYNLRSLQILFQITNHDVSVHWVPQFHDLGLVFGILETVFSGSSTVLLSPVSFISNPFCLLSTINHYRATLSGQPDFAFNLCVDKVTESQKSNLDLSCLRVLYSGAEPVRKRTLDRFLDAFSPVGLRPETFTPGYGMAESTLILTVADVLKPPVYLSVISSSLEKHEVVIATDSEQNSCIQVITSNGKTSLDTEILIVDPETREVLSADKVGEIWGRGSTIGMGYYGRPELTSEIFRASPAGRDEPVWLRTGDLGFLYNGELFITGRLKDLIIIHGRNFYPQDIEHVVEVSHSAIRKTCTAAFSIEKNGKEGLAVVAEISRSIVPLDPDKIIMAIVSAISREFEIQPARIALIHKTAIHKTSSGKIMRRSVRESLLAGWFDTIADRVFEDNEILPLNFMQGESRNLEQFLLQWISIHLNDNLPVNPSNTLSTYGIDSLKAVELTDETQNLFGFEWPQYLFFEEISITQLAGEGQKLMEEE